MQTPDGWLKVCESSVELGRCQLPGGQVEMNPADDRLADVPHLPEIYLAW